MLRLIVTNQLSSRAIYENHHRGQVSFLPDCLAKSGTCQNSLFPTSERGTQVVDEAVK